MVEADLSPFRIGKSAAGRLPLPDVLVLQLFADGGTADGSEDTVPAQIDFLYVHLVEADLATFSSVR